MMIKCNLKMGGNTYQFEIDEKDEMETLHKAVVLSNPRHFCNVCKNDGFDTKHFTSNKDKEGNVYVNVRCSCGARSKLGQYKAGGYFWHEYEVFEKKTKDQTSDEGKDQPEDDMPF